MPRYHFFLALCVLTVRDISHKKMTDYELLYIVSGDKAESEVTTVTDEINNSLTKVGGKITDENLWGRRRLAYPIAKQDHGWYVVTKFSLDGPKLNDWQSTLRIQSDVVRSMIIRADELPTEEEAARIEESVSNTERTARAKQARSKDRASEATQVPEELAKTAKRAEVAKPAAPADKSTDTDEADAIGAVQSKKEETAEEQRARQAKLEEKLDEILKEE